jgi:hypothetical protein
MALGWKGSYTRYREFFLNISALYKKSAELRAFLEIMLSLSTIIIFLLFALKPTAVTIIDLLQQIKEKQATLAGLTKKVDDLQKAGVLLQQNQAFIPNINLAVFTLPKPDIYAEQVLGLAAKNSIEILGFSVNQITLVGTVTSKNTSEFTPLPGDAKEMSFTLSLKGPYSSLVAFVKDFENLRISTKIDSLGINSSVSEKGLVITSVISGRVPYLGN